MTDQTMSREHAAPLDAAEKERKLEELDRLARMLDTQWRIPGTGIRFGVDGLASIVPGIGDVATGAVSAWIVYQGVRLGVPKHVLGRMVGNVALDTILGSVPLLGTVFDVFYKANNRNVRVMRKHLERELEHTRRKASR